MRTVHEENGVKFNVFTAPEVYLVAASRLLEAPVEAFLRAEKTTWSKLESFVRGEQEDFNHGHDIPELAGRVCYMSFGKKEGRGGPDYLKHILEVGHGSVLEHFNMSFIVCGVSRTLTHELVRHRAGFAYSQLSQRYVDEDGIGLVIPPEVMRLADADKRVAAMTSDFATSIRKYDELTEVLAQEYTAPKKLFEFAVLDGVFERKVAGEGATHYYVYALKGVTSTEETWLDVIAKDEGLRDTLVKDTRTVRRKAVRSTARAVLPNCTETKIMVTCNARALRHFLELRGTPAAEIEIRRLAVQLLRLVQPMHPWLFGDYSTVATPDGVGQIVTEYRKV